MVLTGKRIRSFVFVFSFPNFILYRLSSSVRKQTLSHLEFSLDFQLKEKDQLKNEKVNERSSEAMHAMNETELERFMSKGTVASLIFSLDLFNRVVEVRG